MVNFHWIFLEGTALDFVIVLIDFPAIFFPAHTWFKDDVVWNKSFLHEEEYENDWILNRKVCEETKRKLRKILGKFFGKFIFF